MHRCAGGSEALQNVALGHSMYLPANRFPVEQNCPGCHKAPLYVEQAVMDVVEL